VFIGHYGVAFGARRFAPGVSLGILFLAAQLADLLWPNLVLLGIEQFRIDPGATAMTPLDFIHYPWSHSLVALTVWGVLFALLYAGLMRAGRTAAFVIAALVLSHWVLDVVSHRADMPVLPGAGLRVGLGLWNYPAAAVIVELGLFAGGVWLYLSKTRAKDRIGSVGLWALVAFLLAVHVANTLGPPPPSVAAVAWSAQAMWLLVVWGFWVDRHRSFRGTG
jgi:membrane-bound metal-dependent hydrolase YbcI (DUF457 family)